VTQQIDRGLQNEVVNTAADEERTLAKRSVGRSLGLMANTVEDDRSETNASNDFLIMSMHSGKFKRKIWLCFFVERKRT